MKSLIKFISDESIKRGQKVTTSEVRESIDTQVIMYRRAIQELEDLRKQTYKYDDMEETLEKIKADQEGILE